MNPTSDCPVVNDGLIADRLTSELGLETDLAKSVVLPLIQNLRTLERKQKDYGPHNLLKFGTYGVVVRMGDKMERIINLKKQDISFLGQHDALNEPLSDSFLDMANYGLIAYVMERGYWPRPERPALAPSLASGRPPERDEDQSGDPLADATSETLVVMRMYERLLDDAITETRANLLQAEPGLQTKHGFREIPFIAALVPMEKMHERLLSDIAALEG